jgi:hypothetical protein
MRRYNFWQAIIMSFYSRNLYRDIAKNWNVNVALYLLMILTLSWLPSLFQMHKRLAVDVPVFTEYYLSQVPVITIKEGIVTTPEDRPYLILNKDDSNQVIGAIDTSGQYTKLDDTTFSFLLTKDALITRDKDNSITIHKISYKLNKDLIPAEFAQTISTWYPWLWLIFLPFLVLFSFVYRILQAAFFALIGKVFAIMLEIPISYGNIVKLTMVALTPAIIAKTLFAFYGIESSTTLGLLVVTLLYVFFAVYANKEN